MSMTTERTPTPTRGYRSSVKTIFIFLKLASEIKRFFDSLSAPESFENVPGFSEIKDLVSSLSSLDGVKQVRAVARKPWDLHDVTFELLVDVNADEELDDVGFLWEEAERRAFRVHRDLRKTTGEEWHFNAELVREFESINKACLITTSHYAQRSYSS